MIDLFAWLKIRQESCSNETRHSRACAAARARKFGDQVSTKIKPKSHDVAVTISHSARTVLTSYWVHSGMARHSSTKSIALLSRFDDFALAPKRCRRRLAKFRKDFLPSHVCFGREVASIALVPNGPAVGVAKIAWQQRHRCAGRVDHRSDRFQKGACQVPPSACFFPRRVELVKALCCVGGPMYAYLETVTGDGQPRKSPCEIDLRSKEAVGRRLKTLRLGFRGSAQAQMTVKIGGTPGRSQTWANYETGDNRRPEVEVGQIISSKFGVNILWIYDGNEALCAARNL